MRTLTEKELIHERLGDRFKDALSLYDTQRRLDVLVNEFFGEDYLRGKQVLEVGAGLGFFSERLQQRGATVTATDIGEGLLRRVRERVGCECLQVDALRLVEAFGANRFDVVLSSECIEHTPSPADALRQMCRVLKTGGKLAVSTPNRLWYPVVRTATTLKLRAFDGLENFSSFGTIREVLASEHVNVVREKGLHLFPFQFPLHGLSHWCDEHLQSLKECMINLCVLGQKQ
ncbi:MAG: class I SAM-dependent methyltransferase [Acidobacteriota bacterium]|nr:class I SAM-dependent methyltransferase [Acidobacteriota bacterium]